MVLAVVFRYNTPGRPNAASGSLQASIINRIVPFSRVSLGRHTPAAVPPRYDKSMNRAGVYDTPSSSLGSIDAV